MLYMKEVGFSLHGSLKPQLLSKQSDLGMKKTRAKRNEYRRKTSIAEAGKRQSGRM